MLRIVVVDDNKEDLALAQRVLAQCKILNPITLLRSGEEACAYVKTLERPTAIETERALILLELVMSPVSGLAVLRFWEDSAARHSSVVVMISGLTDVKAIDQGYKLGAKTYLLKPLKVDDFVHLLGHLKERIAVAEQEDGYMLEWIEPTLEASGDAKIIRNNQTTDSVALSV